MPALRPTACAPARGHRDTPGGAVFVHQVANATYFLLHQLREVRQAIDDLFVYSKRKTRERCDVQNHLRDRDDLDHPAHLLVRALCHPDERLTIQQHQRASGSSVVARRVVRPGWLSERARGAGTRARVLVHGCV